MMIVMPALPTVEERHHPAHVCVCIYMCVCVCVCACI